MSQYAEIYSMMFRCCGFIKHPEIEIVNINDEYYVNNDNFQERIKDLKYFNHYCYSKSRFLLFFLLPFALGLIGFSLSVERKVIIVSSIVYGIFYVLFGLLLFSPPSILLRYFGIVQCGLLISNVIVLIYWLSLILGVVRFWTSLCTILAASSVYLSASVSYFVCRIQTVYRFIPKEYHQYLY